MTKIHNLYHDGLTSFKFVRYLNQSQRACDLNENFGRVHFGTSPTRAEPLKVQTGFRTVLQNYTNRFGFTRALGIIY